MYVPSSPAVAPDMAKCAVGLVQPTRLVLLGLPQQHSLGTWLLPSLAQGPLSWRWDSNSQVLAIPWGAAFQGEILDKSQRERTSGHCGLSLLNTSAGDVTSAAFTDVALGCQEVDAAVLGPWSRCGLLAVRHQRGGELVWTLFTSMQRTRCSGDSCCVLSGGLGFRTLQSFGVVVGLESTRHALRLQASACC